jgi:hypothetical protein
VKYLIDNDKITKFVDQDLIFYLYDKNFLNWDFYMVNFLISFKDIRRSIGKRMLHGERVKLEKSMTNKISYKKYSENNTCYSFIFTHSDNVNVLYKIVPCRIYANIPSLRKDRWFDFNLRQMKHIEIISGSNKPAIEIVIKKLLSTGKQNELSLDVGKLECITPITFQFMLNTITKEFKQKANWICNYM